MQCSNTISFTTIPQASCEKLVAGHLSIKLLRLKTTNPCFKHVCPIFIVTFTLLPAERLASHRKIMLITRLVSLTNHLDTDKQIILPFIPSVYLLFI
jgi:hypothetical protein